MKTCDFGSLIYSKPLVWNKWFTKVLKFHEAVLRKHQSLMLYYWIEILGLEAIWLLWPHCNVQETSLRLFELCDMVSYPAKRSITWLYCGHKGMDMVSNNTQVKRCSVRTRGPKLCQENILLTITPTAAWTIDIRQDRSMLSHCLCQILTLSECWSRDWDTSDQTKCVLSFL